MLERQNYWSLEAWKALNIKEVPYLAVRWQYIKCAVFKLKFVRIVQAVYLQRLWGLYTSKKKKKCVQLRCQTDLLFLVIQSTIFSQYST